MSLHDQDPNAAALPPWLRRWCVDRRLHLWLALVGVLLTANSLGMGFHLDDYLHRYMLSDRPGAADLLRAYESPFGVANGEPADNQWQVEQGYAPWWIERDLLVSLWRPLSELTHVIDAALWPDNAVVQHAHNLVWFALLIVAVTILYRQVIGATAVAGLASLLYAVSHTHGFAVGWIANRNALVSATFGVLALWAYDRGRGAHGSAARWGAVALLACALLSGEGAIAVVGYMVAHALWLDRASIRERIIALAPHLLLTVAWRGLYNWLGRGAHGSGLYLDPVREPLAFAEAALTRVPLLVMGQFAFPPAEGYVLGPVAWAPYVLGFAIVVSLMWLLASLPLAAVDPGARFWLTGTIFALIPNCTTYANNRLLFFVGIGAMALLAQLWAGFLARAPWLPRNQAHRAVAHVFVGGAMVLHLFVSPLLLPLSTRSVAFTRPIQSALAPLSTDATLQDRDLLLLNAPEYFYVKLIPALRALNGQAPVQAIHALSYGAIATRVVVTGTHALEVHYEGGILQDAPSQLYRRADLRVKPGDRFDYGGCGIEVLGVELDGRANHVRFVFDRALSDPAWLPLRWDGDQFVQTRLPAVREALDLPPAPLPLQIP